MAHIGIRTKTHFPLLTGLVYLTPLFLAAGPCLADLTAAIERVKPSIVGVGTVQKIRRPPYKIVGTGFVVADGHYVITHAHVIPHEVNTAKREYLAIFAGKNKQMNIRQAEQVKVDEAHDLALLKFEGKSLPALALGQSTRVIVPLALQANAVSQLDPAQIRRLRKPYKVFQLDATAYPGNSGSPMYHTETTEVIGVINKVFVKDGRENVLAKPSGISYAMPIEYARKLLEGAGLK